MLIRGYEIRRSDSFTLLNDTMKELFEMILDGNDWAAVEMAKGVIDEVKSGKSDVTDLVISRSCKGRWDSRKNAWSFDMYAKPDSLPYVRAAKQRISRDLQFTPGMKVGWIVTDSKSSPMEIKAWLVDEIGEEPPKYDPDYYSRRLAKSLGRITSAFNWDEKELLKGSRQQSLLDF